MTNNTRKNYQNWRWWIFVFIYLPCISPFIAINVIIFLTWFIFNKLEPILDEFYELYSYEMSDILCTTAVCKWVFNTVKK